ncbi:1060_t:CDS:2, partial [Dentiscutata erythropus]
NYANVDGSEGDEEVEVYEAIRNKPSNSRQQGPITRSMKKKSPENTEPKILVDFETNPYESNDEVMEEVRPKTTPVNKPDLDEVETYFSETSDYWDEDQLYENPWQNEKSNTSDEYREVKMCGTDENPALYLTETVKPEKPEKTTHQTGILNENQESAADKLFTEFADV